MCVGRVVESVGCVCWEDGGECGCVWEGGSECSMCDWRVVVM